MTTKSELRLLRAIRNDLEAALKDDTNIRKKPVWRAALTRAIGALSVLVDLGPSIEANTEADGLTGPENSRGEVVGTSTYGTSKNFSNTGFGGGSLGRLGRAA